MNFAEVEAVVGWNIGDKTDRCLRGYQIREQEIHDSPERKIEVQVIFEAIVPSDLTHILALIRAAKIRECPGYLEGMTSRLNKIAVYQTPSEPTLITIQLGIQSKRSALGRIFPNALGSSPKAAPKKESKIDKRFAKIEIDPEGAYEFDPETGKDRIVSIKRDGDDSTPKKLDLVIPIRHVGRCLIHGESVAYAPEGYCLKCAEEVGKPDVRTAPVAVYQCPFNYCDAPDVCSPIGRCRHS